MLCDFVQQADSSDWVHHWPKTIIHRLRAIAGDLATGSDFVPARCACVPECGPTAVVQVPLGVPCRLLRGASWSFDLVADSEEGTALNWVLARLEEFYFDRNIMYSFAQFPGRHLYGGWMAPGRRASSRPSPNSVFGPVSWLGEVLPRSLTDTGLYVRLRSYSPPAKLPLTPLRTKWLSYLCRGEVPEEKRNSFPPLTSALLNIMEDPQFDEDAADALWGSYDRCDIDIWMGEGWTRSNLDIPFGVGDRQPIALKGIHGFTVIFLALPSFSARLKLLDFWKPQQHILTDFVKHSLGWLLYRRDDPESRQPFVWEAMMNRLFAKTLQEENSITSIDLCQRLSLIFCSWLARRNKIDVCPESVEVLVETVRDIGRIADWDPWECVSATSHKRLFGLASAQCEEPIASYRLITLGDASWDEMQTDLLGIWRGCVVGTMVKLAWDQAWFKSQVVPQQEFIPMSVTLDGAIKVTAWGVERGPPRGDFLDRCKDTIIEALVLLVSIDRSVLRSCEHVIDSGRLLDSFALAFSATTNPNCEDESLRALRLPFNTMISDRHWATEFQGGAVSRCEPGIACALFHDLATTLQLGDLGSTDDLSRTLLVDLATSTVPVHFSKLLGLPSSDRRLAEKVTAPSPGVTAVLPLIPPASPGMSAPSPLAAPPAAAPTPLTIGSRLSSAISQPRSDEQPPPTSLLNSGSLDNDDMKPSWPTAKPTIASAATEKVSSLSDGGLRRSAQEALRDQMDAPIQGYFVGLTDPSDSPRNRKIPPPQSPVREQCEQHTEQFPTPPGQRLDTGQTELAGGSDVPIAPLFVAPAVQNLQIKLPSYSLTVKTSSPSKLDTSPPPSETEDLALRHERPLSKDQASSPACTKPVHEEQSSAAWYASWLQWRPVRCASWLITSQESTPSSASMARAPPPLYSVCFGMILVLFLRFWMLSSSPTILAVGQVARPFAGLRRDDIVYIINRFLLPKLYLVKLPGGGVWVSLAC